MIWSRFNYLFSSPKYGNFVYNSRTNSFMKVNEELFDILKQIECSKGEISDLDEQILNALIKAKVLVNKGEDNNFILQKKLLYYTQSFSKKRLNLVIAPTYSCNFSCPYCYEHNLPKINATDEVGNNIITFIKSAEESQELAISWYGGEPLINFRFIQDFLKKIKKQDSIHLVDHSLVTNGYLLTREKINFFRDFELDLLQVTIDGPPETHNKLRRHKTGAPTYDVIIDNIDMYTDIFPNKDVVIRINICEENINEFPILYNELVKRWGSKRCHIYPEYVNDHGDCKVSCIEAKNKILFYRDLYIKNNIKSIDFYPRFELGGCSATKISSFVVGPLGELYKCWVDLGKMERVIGNVNEPDFAYNYNLISEYTLGSDMYSDPKCDKCFFFPACDGGCCLQRLEYKLNGTNYTACPSESENMDIMLEIFYEQQIQKRNQAAAAIKL